MLKTSFQLLHARHNFISALRLWFAETRRLGNPVQDKILVKTPKLGLTSVHFDRVRLYTRLLPCQVQALVDSVISKIRRYIFQQNVLWLVYFTILVSEIIALFDSSPFLFIFGWHLLFLMSFSRSIFLCPGFKAALCWISSEPVAHLCGVNDLVHNTKYRSEKEERKRKKKEWKKLLKRKNFVSRARGQIDDFRK